MNTSGVIAVTGTGGFVGRGLVERLVQRSPGLQVVALDRRRPYRLDERARFERADLTDPGAEARLAETLVRQRVDTVVHAAFRSSPTPDLDADHELETIGSLHVLNACASAKVSRLVVASSTMLYGARPDNPNFLTEEHPLRGHPDAHGVRNRVEVESLLGDWRVQHPEVVVSVLRTCWLFGPTYWDHVTRYFARPIVPTVLGYDPLMQFLHERDCLDAFERAALEPRPGTFNVVGRGVLPLSTILRLGGRRSLPIPTPLLYRLTRAPSRGRSGDSPAGFYDYLRYLWVADGSRGWEAYGEPVYTTKEAWISFVSSRRMRRYR